MNSPITTALLLVTVLVSWQAWSRPELFEKLLYQPYRVKHFKEYYRIFSHALVHGNWPHLIFNGLALYSFGKNLEVVFGNEEYFTLLFPGITYMGAATGKLYFILLYVAGVAVAAIPGYIKHKDNPAYRSVGASGGASAVIMASAILFPTSQIMLFFIPMPAFVFAFVFLGLEHFMNRRGGTGIAHDAHIWGALFGIAFVALINIEFIKRFFQVVGSIFG